ncbi:MAG TPA: NAD(P)/FAD-dependent oxidoreductase, partial [Planctomycetota bacterium]|nr:NAD(P)/FAD-dependent oxidoreductase [Planctomycetota bacterium]
AEVVSVDPDAREVILSDSKLSYDYLVLATGATHSYFGHDDWAPFAPGLKTIEDALEIRRRLLLAFERAERESDPERQREWLTFIIVGGGPTGVELAGAIVEISRRVLIQDFRSIDPSRARILLLEAGARILPTFPPDLSEKAREHLAALGVEVRLQAPVTGIGRQSVSIGEERVAARTVVWAAGVAASPVAKSLGVRLDRAGHVPVTPELTLPGRNEIYVIGDLALLQQDGKPLPGVAPVAMQAGEHTAANLRRAFRKEPLVPFRYRDKGSLAVIGRGSGVAAFSGHTWSGALAWWAWLIVHIFYLIGFRNRVLVLLQWAWAYLTWQRGARLITSDLPREDPAPPKPQTG